MLSHALGMPVIQASHDEEALPGDEEAIPRKEERDKDNNLPGMFSTPRRGF
jgi:hypothetical protein